MSQQNIQLVHDLVGSWNTHDIGRVEAFYASDYEGEDVAEANPQRGPYALRHFIGAALDAFPDVHLEIEHCVAQADQVAVFWTINGTHLGRTMNIPPTGRTIPARGASLLKVTNGKISYGLQVWDVAGMLRTIGLLPDLTQ